MKKEYIINACLYQLGWFSCMLLPESLLGAAVTIACLTIHLSYRSKYNNEIIFITSGTILGYSMDLCMNYFDLMNIRNQSSSSLYLILIWILFSTALRSSSLFVLNKLPYTIILGLIAPAAYLGGQFIGRIKYAEPQITSLAIHAFIWIFTMVALFYINKKYPVVNK